MAKAFRGSGTPKVDGKGRVSILASFRDVIADEDPACTDGKNPKFVLVYGDETRNYLQGFSLGAMAEVDARIQQLPRSSDLRKRLEEFYSGQAEQLTIDDTGRIVLPKVCRDKLGIEQDEQILFTATGDTFEIWRLPDYEAEKARRAAESPIDLSVDPEQLLDEIGL